MPSFTRRALLAKLAIAAAPAIEDAGKHTLIVVFLRGGADTLGQGLADGGLEADNLVLLVGKAEGRVLAAHRDTDFFGVLDRRQIIGLNS